MANTESGNQPGKGPLRQGGKEVLGPMRDQDLPSTRSKASTKQMPAVQICRDLWGGNEVVKSKTTQYLPQSPGEDGNGYQERLTRSVFFNAYGRSVEGLTGLVFRQDPVLGDDVPPVIREHWENIDNSGTHGDVFAHDRMQDSMIAGHCLILVEFPRTGGVQTAADEQGGIRPYWVPIRKEDIMSWRTAVIAGRTIVIQLVLRECQMVPDGEYGEVEQVRYRVFYNIDGIVGYRLVQVTDDKRVVLIEEGTYPTQQEIPVAEVVTSGRKGIFESDPPLIDLAYLNIAHYQQWSDAAYSRYKTCVPMLFGAGISPETNDDGSAKPMMVVGPNTSIMVPNPDADMKYVAHDGASLGQCHEAIDDLKSDMGTMGVAMLAPQKRSAETAEAKRLDKATSDSALSVTARGLQDGLERALQFHANYLRLPSGGSVEINRDFEGLAMDPAVMTAFAALIAQGLDWSVALDQLQKGGRIAEDVDVPTLALEMASARAAERQFQQDMQESRAEAMTEQQQQEAA